MTTRALTCAFALLLGLLSGCGANAPHGRDLVNTPDAIRVLPTQHTVLIGCEVCHNPESPGMDGFSRRTQGFSGCTEGRNEPHFIFKSTADYAACDAALRRAGARSRQAFAVDEGIRRLASETVSADDFLDGTPVLASIRWRGAGGEVRELAYERFFVEKELVRGGEEIERPWTPHFVYHGSGRLNEVNRGCLVCQQDCPGGLVCNNQDPCLQPVPQLEPDWTLIPPPGTVVTLVLRILPETAAPQ